MAFGFDERHPEYVARLPDWTLIDDTYSNRLKQRGAQYLPIPSGYVAQGLGVEADTTRPKPGQALYDAYLTRALAPDLVRQTAQSLTGVMVREPWQVEVPGALEEMLTDATTREEPIEALVARMLEQVLLFGRFGMFLDVNMRNGLPYIVDQTALRIINWDDTPESIETSHELRLVVLDESGHERRTDAFNWDFVQQYRALELTDGVYTQRVARDDGAAQAPEPVALSGNRTLDFIPFEFVNATDLVASPGEVPLLGLATLVLGIYRGEADYRQNLFMQGQDTLVVTGAQNPAKQQQIDPSGGSTANKSEVVVGHGGVLFLPKPDMDAKFVGVTGTGLSEQREALVNDYKRAEQFGMTLLTSGNEAEAAETIRTRVTARTASLASIAKNSGAALESILRSAATWVGANPDEVNVTPSLDFVASRGAPSDFVAYVQAKLAGAPVSWQTIHDWAQRVDLTPRSWDEEMEAISEEAGTINDDLDVGEPAPPDGSDRSENPNDSDNLNGGTPAEQ